MRFCRLAVLLGLPALVAACGGAAVSRGEGAAAFDPALLRQEGMRALIMAH